MTTDYTLTLEDISRASVAHGGGADVLTGKSQGHEWAEITDIKGNADGWQTIGRDTATGLYSLSDLRGALGY